MNDPRIEPVTTFDGSDTLYRQDLGQHYHSVHGAIEESQQVFIRNGLNHFIDRCFAHDKGFTGPVRIFEMGFGTGLNALLTYAALRDSSVHADYLTVEAFPLAEEHWLRLNYPRICTPEMGEKIFHLLHSTDWGSMHSISSRFNLMKYRGMLQDMLPLSSPVNVIYYDAFSPEAQPELWTEEIFRGITEALVPGGILVTYCVKGTVVRALRSCGLQIEKLPGPTGKRHVLRATKAGG